LTRRIDGIQAGLRTVRAEMTGLHTRIGLLEYRLNTMDVRISELPIGVEELKARIDLRIDVLEVAARTYSAPQRRINAR
jgi:hypothetical protein